MARRATKDMTVEEFDRWCAARRDVDEVMEVTAEEGGPRVSLVPEPRSVPLDFLPDAVQLPVPAPPPGVVPFKPEPSRKTVGGWNAARQRRYIETLAETGSVHLSAKSAGLSLNAARIDRRSRRPHGDRFPDPGADHEFEEIPAERP